MRPIFFILLISSLSFVGCSKKKTVQNAANAYCDCLQPSAEFNKLQEALVQANNADSLAKIVPIGKSINEEAYNCLARYKDQYGDLARSEKFKKDAFKIVEQECPDVYEYIPSYYK